MMLVSLCRLRIAPQHHLQLHLHPNPIVRVQAHIFFLLVRWSFRAYVKLDHFVELSIGKFN